MNHEHENVNNQEDNHSESNLSHELKSAMKALLNAKVKDIVAFTKELAKEAGIDLSAVSTSANATSQAPVEEKTEFTVSLTDIGSQKINVIKVVKELTGLGLMEAKNLVESAANGPALIKQDIKKEVAEEIKQKIEGAGGKVSIT